MGKGGGKSSARGGGGGGRVLSEQTFQSKDLKTGKDRIGENARFNSEVGSYADSVASEVKPGDKITIEKTFKDGTTQSATLTVKAENKTWRDGSTTTQLNVEKSGSLNLPDASTSGYFGTVGRSPWGANLAADITADRSKVRSVKITLRR